MKSILKLLLSFIIGTLIIIGVFYGIALFACGLVYLGTFKFFQIIVWIIFGFISLFICLVLIMLACVIGYGIMDDIINKFIKRR